MVAVPAVSPVTLPEASIVATVMSLLLQVPPVTASASVVVPPPAHTVVVPVIVPADGPEPTLTVAVARLVPQLLVTE